MVHSHPRLVVSASQKGLNMYSSARAIGVLGCSAPTCSVGDAVGGEGASDVTGWANGG